MEALTDFVNSACISRIKSIQKAHKRLGETHSSSAALNIFIVTLFPKTVRVTKMRQTSAIKEVQSMSLRCYIIKLLYVNCS